jgi:hypothetical protein
MPEPLTSDQNNDWYLKPLLMPIVVRLQRPGITEQEIFELLKDVWWAGKED